MSTTIRFNGSINGMGRKSKITLSSEKKELIGPQSFYNEKGEIIAEITYKNGIKEGPAFLFIENYNGKQNAVELFDYQNNSMQRSEVYLIEGNDIHNRKELVRVTHFENDIVVDDTKYQSEIIKERFNRNKGNLVNYYYTKTGELDMAIKVNSDGSSLHITKSEAAGKFNLIKFKEDRSVDLKVMYYQDNSFNVFSEGNYVMDSNPNHTNITNFGVFEYSYEKNKETEHLVLIRNKMTDGFDEKVHYLIEKGEVKRSSFVYEVDIYKVVIENEEICVFSGNSIFIPKTKLKKFKLGLIDKMKLLFSNLEKSLLMDIIERYHAFKKIESHLIENTNRCIKKIINLDDVDYEGII